MYPVREVRSRHQRRVRDPHAVVHLVALLQTSQNADRVRQRRLLHDHRLESTRQRAVLLDAVAVLLQRRGSHARQITSRQRGLQNVGAIHRSRHTSRTHEGVQLIDEENDLTVALLHVLQHALQSLLEGTSEASTSNHGSQVQ